MTPIEKADSYDAVIKIIKDRMALETYKRSNGRLSGLEVSALRAEAYGAIVDLTVGHDPRMHLMLDCL